MLTQQKFFNDNKNNTAKVFIANEDILKFECDVKFHAVLCDPPYHLTSIVNRFGKDGSAPAKYGKDGAFQRVSRGFFQKEWDGGDIAFRPETWQSVYSKMFPGAYGFAFSSPRTYHRMAVAVEDGGAIIYPFIGWLYGSGMPKATRIDTRVDKDVADDFSGYRYGAGVLKPALEPIAMFQVPYDNRPLDNIAENGSGAINIDDTRIPSDEPYVINTWDDNAHPFGDGAGNEYTSREETGRWPANLVLGNSLKNNAFPETGKSSGGRSGHDNAYGGGYSQDFYGDKKPGYGDSGNASRYFYAIDEKINDSDPFFYSSKTSKREKENGLIGKIPCSVCGKLDSTTHVDSNGRKKNCIRCVHPTLKPLSLCKYLATMLLPPKRYAPRRLFIPFSGVMSEVIGAIQAGWDEVYAVELEKEYCDIGILRLKHYTGIEATWIR